MTKILYTTPILEYPPAGGPFLRVYTSIKALNQISELHIVSRVSPDEMGGQKSLKIFSSLSKKCVFTPSALSHQSLSTTKNGALKTALLWLYKRISNNLVYQVLRHFQIDLEQQQKSRIDAKFILDYAQKHQISIIWCGYGNISYHLIKELNTLIKQRNSKLFLVVDTDSVWSRFILRKLPLLTSALEKRFVMYQGTAKQAEELELMRLSSVMTAVSRIDMSEYQSMSTTPEKVQLFSNVIDLDMYQNAGKSNLKLSKPFVYLGGYFGPQSPTDYAARWMIEKVMPLVWKKYPSLHFYIVGKGADYTLSDIQDPRICVVGQVESMVPYLSQASVSVVPLQYESGTRFKILEAGACSVPVVSTTLGAEGLRVSHTKDLLIADTPQSFAKAICLVLENRPVARKLGKQLHQTIEKEYSVTALIKEAEQIISFLKASN